MSIQSAGFWAKGVRANRKSRNVGALAVAAGPGRTLRFGVVPAAVRLGRLRVECCMSEVTSGRWSPVPPLRDRHLQGGFVAGGHLASGRRSRSLSSAAMRVRVLACCVVMCTRTVTGA